MPPCIIMGGILMIFAIVLFDKTLAGIAFYRKLLLSNVQRAKVESKSQPLGRMKQGKMSCYQMYKELKLKANHNKLHGLHPNFPVVIKCTKS